MVTVMIEEIVRPLVESVVECPGMPDGDGGYWPHGVLHSLEDMCWNCGGTYKEPGKVLDPRFEVLRGGVSLGSMVRCVVECGLKLEMVVGVGRNSEVVVYSEWDVGRGSYGSGLTPEEAMAMAMVGVLGGVA
jgi:hypothetical protein